MSQLNLIIVGAGGHSRSCVDVIEQNGSYNISGLLGLPKEVGTSIFGYEVIASDKDLPLLVKRYKYILIAIGQITCPEKRIDLYNKACNLGFELPVIVSPRAYVSSRAQLGAGTIVMHGSVVNAGAKIGKNCIINTQALIEHDSVVGDHCHISTRATLNGNVRIGEGTFIGSSSVIKEGLSIGARCIVGMGLSVRNDLEPYTKLAKL